MDDDELTSKLDDFQAEAQIKAAVSASIVLFIQCCLILVVAVVVLGSPETLPPTENQPADSQVNNTKPTVYEIVLPASADTYVNEGSKDMNYGSQTTMLLTGKKRGGCRLLIGFALPDLTNYTLKKAELVLTPNDGWDTQSPPLKIRVCEGAWNEQTVTMTRQPKKGMLTGYLSEGQGGSGGKVRIPLDINALSSNNFKGLWVETTEQMPMIRFMTRESGKGGPALRLQVEGVNPPPVPAGPSVDHDKNSEDSLATSDNNNSSRGSTPPANFSGRLANSATTQASAGDKDPWGQVPEGRWTRVLFEDFEKPDVQDYSKGVLPEGGRWLGARVGYYASRWGLTDKAAGDFKCPDPNRQAFAMRYANAGLVSAPGVIGPLAPNLSYRLSFDVVRDEGSKKGTDYRAQFVAFDKEENREDMSSQGSRQGTRLADLKGKALDNGAFESVSLVFTPDADQHFELLGRDMAVRFIGYHKGALIDNVKVEVFRSNR